MWDLYRDYMIWILGAIISLIQLIQGIKNKKSVGFLIFLGVVILSFIGLGIDQTHSNKRGKKESDDKINSMSVTLGDMQKAKSKDSAIRVSDSTKNAEFQKELFVEYEIIRDSSNKPVPANKTFNTSIHHVDKLIQQ